MQTIIVSREGNAPSAIVEGVTRTEFGRERRQSTTLARALAEAGKQGDVPTAYFYYAPRFGDDACAELRALCDICGKQAIVIAVGVEFDTQSTLQAIRSGAFDVLRLDGSFERELNNVYGRWVRSRGDERATAVTIAVQGVCGGVGASLLAANLAVAAAERQLSCCLLDLQPRGGDQALLFNASPRYDIAALAGKSKQLDAAMFEQSLFVHQSGVRLLGYPLNRVREPAPQPTIVRTISDLAHDAYTCVVGDVATGDDASQRQFVEQADVVVLTMRPDFVALCRAVKALEELAERGVAAERIRCVLNRADQPHGLRAENFMEALRRKIDFAVPDEPHVVVASINTGTPLVSSDQRSKAAAAIRGMSERFVPSRRLNATVAKPSFFQRLCGGSLMSSPVNIQAASA
ncbi:MAG: cellulose synthase operon protein YhjQ/BcsQ [Pirellulales bacterium]